ncbi:ephrin-B2a-like [Scleropages formosus]|uniref:Ephrin-B2a-like n=1 Tax=Scleropages formosus TaxID=113540 RepID=A0A0P7XID2_SCLFO|nr:ephrin-B2a-like [Scleropages formosus]
MGYGAVLQSYVFLGCTVCHDVALCGIVWRSVAAPHVPGQECSLLRKTQSSPRTDCRMRATSDGTRQGLESMRGGVCATRGMKVVLKVGQNVRCSTVAECPLVALVCLLPSSGFPLGPYGLPPKPVKPDQNSGHPNARNPGVTGNSTYTRGAGAGGENGPLPSSNVALIAGAAGGSAFLLLVTAVICVVCYRRRHSKPSESHIPPLSLSSLTSPKRGVGGASGNNNGSEPSDIIIPLRTSDSAYCPHYEKVSGDYGHPVYIVQEMPPQSPANIYYKV